MKRFRRWLFVAAAVLLLMFVLTRTVEPDIEPGSTLVIAIDGAYVEAASAPLLDRIFGDAAVPFAALRSELKKAERDSRLANVVFRLRSPQLGWAQAQELRGLIADLKAAGRHTVAHMETQNFVSNLTYYIATAADEISVAPAAMVGVIGLSAEYVFFGTPWEKIGVDFEVTRAGRFKTYADTFAESSMPESGREQANSLLDSINSQFVGGIAEGRGLTTEFVARSIDTAPMGPDELLDLGLVDRVGFVEDVIEALGGRRVNAGDYVRVAPATVGFEPVATFALIYGSGSVVMGRGQATPSGSLVLASDTVSQAFADAAGDPEIDAIIFRVDSPGGSVLASDLVWRAIRKARAGGKPVIASMVNAAASGGYYVSSAADETIASAATVTGSIGVIALRPVIRGLLDQLEIGVEVFKRGEYSDMFALSKRPDAASRDRLDRQVEDVYQLFLSRVSDARGMPVERVDELGQGRVWTGEQAQRMGLIDAIGGLSEAVETAKRRIGLDAEADVALVPFPAPRSLSDQVSEAFRQVAIRASLRPSLPGVWGRVQRWFELAAWDAPLAMPPFWVEIR